MSELWTRVQAIRYRRADSAPIPLTSGGAVQRRRLVQQLLDVGQLAVGVAVSGAHDALAVNHEHRPHRSVGEAVQVLRDAERPHRLGVPVREQRIAEAEPPRPLDVRVGAVARDAYNRHAQLPELRAPVTQEPQLTPSGAGPVVQVEGDHRGAQIAQTHPLGVDAEEAEIGDQIAGGKHALPSLATSGYTSG